MKKVIGIIAGEPNSISSEIIFKSWKLRKNYIHKPFIIIGSIDVLNSQKKRLGFNIKLKKINHQFKIKELKKNILPVYDVYYKQKKPFLKTTTKSNKYIFKCFDEAIKLINNGKISGFINCPVVKETLFKNKYQGVTEFLSKKAKTKGDEVMLIYNKKLSVAPLTTHIPLNQISKKIRKEKIVEKVKVINKFYNKNFNKNPHIAILGLNPHNFSNSKINEEKKNNSACNKYFKKK